MENLKRIVSDSINLKNKVFNSPELLQLTLKVADEIVKCFQNDGKVLFCGNGGSAADAQHLAAEFSGRFYYDRPPLFSEALHVNTSYITAVANDYSYDEIYARLIQAKGKKGDILIGLSTSGNSNNVVRAFEQARKQGMIVIAMTGETGGKMKDCCDYLINVPSKDTPRIQEVHMLLGHAICEIVESRIFPK
ncbi:MAG: D-sedoheptulose 7-phosphate isomerase [Bacteroidetes bacterium]|nr:D-sedoheptulose 7-phosphate isomerase [Bacteroidota bacterium]